MDLRELETLRAIAELGSFGAAAKRMRLTQPAISQQVKKLEDELGETLVLRSRPKVELTQAGMLVLASAERIFEEIQNLSQQFAPVSDRELKGVLRVSASALGMVYLYGDLLEEFISTHPNVELTVTTTENSLEGARKVLSRSADIAFAAFPIDLPNVEAVPLGEAEHILIASPKHTIGVGGSKVSLEDIRNINFIRYEEGAGSRRATDRIFEENGGYPPVIVESNDTEFIKRMVVMGLGVSIVPGFTVKREINEGRLCGLLISDQDIFQQFGFVFRRDVRMRVVESFREFCSERAIGTLRVFPSKDDIKLLE